MRLGLGLAVVAMVALAACSSSPDAVTRAALAPTTAPTVATAAPEVTTTAPIVATTAAPVGPTAADTGPPPPAGAFIETFDGAPGSPQPWAPDDWDLVVHSRDRETWDSLEPMEAMHGPDCAGPPAHHHMTAYEDAVFLCKDHMMTSINAEAYGVIYLTPNQQVDFSQGEAVISWDMSTARDSIRDWVDIWITPFEDTLELPLEEGYPDLSGPPKRAVHVTMDQVNGATWFKGTVYDDFQGTALDADATQTFENHFTPDAARRDRFELHISQDRIRFGMPAYDLWWIDTAMPALDWSTGVVQLGHHSYNPGKQCVDPSKPCGPNTWHWDNVSIDPAVPFTLLRADRRVVDAEATTVGLAAAAPSGAWLRFAGIGEDLEVSADGGRTWTAALDQAHVKPTAPEHFGSFWMPVPAGTERVQFRGRDWWGGPWTVRDISVWSERPPG